VSVEAEVMSGGRLYSALLIFSLLATSSIKLNLKLNLNDDDDDDDDDDDTATTALN